MKTILSFALLFCMASLTVFAQEQNKSKNAIGIDIQPLFSLYSASGENTLQYERMIKGLVLRSGLSLSLRSEEDSSLNGTTTESSSHSITGRLGLARQLTFDKFGLQLGADLAYFNSRSESSIFSPASTDFPEGRENTNLSTHKGYGIQPVVGLSYRFSKHFSLSTEAYGTIRRMVRNTYSDNGGIIDESRQTGWSATSLGDLRFLALIHF